MKIKFNVEISQKDGFKENRINLNGDIDITVKELKELITNEQVSEVTEKEFTVAEGLDGLYIVRYNRYENKFYFLLAPSIVDPQHTILMRKVEVDDFESFVKYQAEKVYDTDELNFLKGKKIKEV